MAQPAVSDSGASTYTHPIAVPPGAAGVAPQLSLLYAGGSGNGPLGYGWSLQGLSVIARCPATVATDGKTGRVSYDASDKLCLDGMRLIQTDESGSATATANAVSVPVATQANDAKGLSATTYREFRTERDVYARIRAYGYANNDTTGASGPAYFKVWMKSGQIFEYGARPNANAISNALITRYAASGAGVPMVWAVSRMSDTAGNSVDYMYEQRNVAWGSGTTAGTPTPGREWNLKEVQYSGNKVVLNYWVDANGADLRTDRSEAYQLGVKNVSVRLLKSITTYVNSPNTTTLGPGTNAVAVKSYVLSHSNGPITKRSRLTKIQECAGSASSTRCLPATEFSYFDGDNDAYIINTAFKNSTLSQTPLKTQTGSTSLMPLDYNGDGKTDLLKVADTPTGNQLWRSVGDGTFAQVTNGTGAGQFNISTNISRADGCYQAFLADVNGDGLMDILRYASATTASGTSCGLSDTAAYVFINAGNGSFTQKAVSGVTLSLKKGALIVGGCTSWCSQPPYGLSHGFIFYLLDINNDGKVDVMTAESPAMPPGGSRQSCTGNCTRVFLGDGTGAFTEVTTNLASKIVYSINNNITSNRDVDGDGLADITYIRLDVNTTPYTVSGGLRSRGDGSFDEVSYSEGCNEPIDFNGDGRADCLKADPAGAAGNKLLVATSASTTQPAANFNLTQTGQELSATAGGVGTQVFDANGDGRQDILRWKDAASSNALYLSNGDGTFTASTTFKLGASNATQLRKSDGSYDFVLGDFTGRGNVEILRTASQFANTDQFSNLLLVKQDPTPPDLLMSVKTGTGLTTTLYYVPLSNATPSNGVSASLGSRYTSDRGNSSYAVAKAQELMPPFYVVATSVVNSGVGTTTVATEFSYTGLKRDIPGRGVLGFREVRRQLTAPNGEALTTVSQYMQTHPYTGMVANTATYRSALNATTAAKQLKSVANVFCDQTNASAASGTAHCPVTAKVARPYLYQSTESGKDLDGTALPASVATTSEYTASGDTKQLESTITGTVAGVAQTFTKKVVNAFHADDTACTAIDTCAWILGRVSKSTVTNTVPNSLDAIPISAGTSTNAKATKGTGP